MMQTKKKSCKLDVILTDKLKEIQDACNNTLNSQRKYADQLQRAKWRVL